VNGVVKMEDIISYKGIRTTNLKNISLQIKKGRFIGIAGPSGSGKSSLAYGTIYAIAQSEWAKVTGTSINEEQNYRIDSYSNIIPAIAMKQDNYNVNPRSTIATFMRIDRAFRLFFSSANHVSPSLFSFNNPQGACPYCNGLGYQSVINQNELIDWNKSISEKPFVLWRKSYYPKLLEKYASSLGIPLYVPLTQLSKIQVDQLLHDKTEEKIPVSYKANGKTRTHRFKYIGYLEDIETLQKDTKHVSSAQKLSSISEVKICPHCKGTRFSDNVLSYKYEGKDIGELYTMEVSDLQPIVERWLRDNKQQSFHHLLLNVNAILRGMIDGNLGYLSLNRSIPSLSGGELQRLRLVNILNSHIDDMMYIIDEPSARLHVSEYDAILKDIKHLRDKGNTVLMIEHNPYFLKSTDYNIYIGPGAGDSGGWITDEIKERSIRISSNKDCSFEKMIYIYHVTENNLYDVSIELPLQHITAMYGPSGSGKSTLAKNIISQYPKTEYIDQKPLRGSVITTIATYSGTMDDIRKAFAVENDADEDYFNFSKEKGQCPTCKGRGKLIYEVDFGKTKIEVHCEDCKGKRFNNKALSFTYKGLSIYDILNLTIDNLIENNIFAESSKITKQLELLQKLGLGYLTLFRTTDTLSGGECQRLKLMKYIGKRLKDKLFIFDEPLRGLSNQNSMNILSLFKEMTVHGATILFIEHNVIGFTSCDYVIEMGPGKGKFGGRVMFQGPMSSFVESKNWEIYKEKL